MAEYYVGEIRIFSGNYAPEGWAMCNGQLLSIAGNEVLYTVLGTTYGGDGQSTFGLPDLRGRVPIGVGGGYALGNNGGAETVTLTTEQLPAHTHTALGNATASVSTPTNAYWASNTAYNTFSGAAPNAALSANCIGSVGGNQEHENMMPFNVLTFIIALNGLFPSPN